MTLDWQTQLAQISAQLAQEEARAECARARALYNEGRFTVALDVIGRPKTDGDRLLVVQCHYGLMKAACMDGAMGSAHDHAAELMRLIPTDPAFRGLRALTQLRLELLKGRSLSEGDIRKVLTASAARVDGLGAVPVLGTHSSYGIGSGSVILNREIELLKKAPSELDPREERERPSLIIFLGNTLAKVVRRTDFARRIDLIVPVPADPARAAERGYSPQEAIGKEMANRLAIPISSQVLRQTRATRKLRDLPECERAAELANSMEVVHEKRHLAEGSTFLLIDDVVTYGTHFREAKHVLEAAGATAVFACAIATGRDNLIPLES